MKSRTLAERRANGATLRAVLGDMTEERVDAIVNAANSRLQHGGGLAGAIVRRGGQIIQEESSKVAPVPVGGAALTSAGNLPARWVVHAVGPRWGEGDEEAKLRSAVRSALETGAAAGARSVSIPAISTGIFGYPKAEGVTTIVDEAIGWLGEHLGSINELHFVAFDIETASLFEKTVKSL